MRSTMTPVLLAAAILLPLGCGHETTGPPPLPSSVITGTSRVPAWDRIELFIKNEPVPKPQSANVFASLHDGSIRFFGVNYGDLHYDWADSWYSRGWGIKYGSKIGWIRFSEDPPDPAVTMFDPSAADVYLFSEDTWNALRSDKLRWEDRWVFENAFLPMLARDPDVPQATLLDVANTYLSYPVAWLLVHNPAAEQSREVLTVLANAPWDDISSRARALLAALP